ncbi:MAG TPA: hypothetical protein VLW85_16905, partial [Myxococcales bacterium]|nr:hypothetical protein [Myxococcales bacterium]
AVVVVVGTVVVVATVVVVPGTVVVLVRSSDMSLRPSRNHRYAFQRQLYITTGQGHKRLLQVTNASSSAIR